MPTCAYTNQQILYTNNWSPARFNQFRQWLSIFGFGKVVPWEVISGQESTPAITINLPVKQTTKTISSDNDTCDDQGYWPALSIIVNDLSSWHATNHHMHRVLWFDNEYRQFPSHLESRVDCCYAVLTDRQIIGMESSNLWILCPPST